MGYYLQIDEQEPTDLASNTGYGDLIRYVHTLSPHDFETLHHLTRYGWEHRVSQLTQETQDALKQSPPKQNDVLTTVQNFVQLLNKQAKGAVVLSVTNGIG